MKSIRIYIVFIIYIFSSDYNTLEAQNPGGVSNSIVWKKFESSRDFEKYGNELFNYNSYKYFDDQRDKLSLDIKPLKKVSMFVVFSSFSEGKILNLENIDDQLFVLNDHNVTSNKSIEYNETFEKPKILSFHDVLSLEANIKKSKFSVDANGRNNSSYVGGISEVIVFDKILKTKEREKIDSYLSIKYGIPLLDTSKYYNSQGDVMWDGRAQFPYQHHLTGLCRDNKSNLYQKQSKNIYSDIDLTIGIDKIEDQNQNNRAEFGNLESFFWADDNRSIDFSLLNGDIYQMNRKWIIQNNILSPFVENMHMKVDFSTSKNFNTELISYLVLGSSDSFDEKSEVNLIKLNKINETEFECFIEFDKLNNFRYKYFTFQQLPKFEIMARVGEVNCNEKVSDIISEIKSTDIEGLSYTILNALGEIALHGEVKSRRQVFSKLPFDEYEIQIHKDGVLNNTLKIMTNGEKCDEDKGTILYPNPIFVGVDFNIESNEFSMEKVEIDILNSIGQIIQSASVEVKDGLIYKSTLRSAGIHKVRLRGLVKEITLDILVVE